MLLNVPTEDWDSTTRRRLPERTLFVSGGKSTSATSTVLVAGTALGGGETWIEGFEIGRGGTGPLSVRGALRSDPEFRRKPWKLVFLKTDDLKELEDGLTSSVGSNDPSLSVDLLISWDVGGVSMRGGGESDRSYTPDARVSRLRPSNQSDAP